MAKQGLNIVILLPLLLSTITARAQFSFGPEINLRETSVCITSFLSTLWVSVDDPPEGFKEESERVGNDLLDLVSLRLKRNGVPFEVKGNCLSEASLSWYVSATGPIGAGYRGGSASLYLSTKAYNSEGTVYPWPVDIYSNGSSFVIGPRYSQNAMELLRVFQEYVLERVEEFVSDWKKVNLHGKSIEKE